MSRLFLQEASMNRVAVAVIGLGLTGLLGCPANAQAVDPYQAMGAVNTPCPNSQCIISFPAVPMGKRLVLTSVSAQLGPANSLLLEGNGVTYFVPKLEPTAINVAQPITLYYAPGATPTARIYAGGISGSTSMVVTVVGYYVPAQ
jgi:hypothetical protein